MARTKAELGAGARLSDFLSASLLARVFPASVIGSILDEQGRNSQRLRSLPAVAGSYFCMALSLYPECAYEQVFAVIAQGTGWMHGQHVLSESKSAATTIAKSSISEMRAKLGFEPLLTLVERACVPLADPKRHPDAFYAGLRLVAIDGSNFELPDEPGNVVAFGYPGSRTGHAGYPQAQCAVLTECATHAILGANLGPYRSSEWEICKPLLSRLGRGMLCLADRGFNGYSHWRDASATGADLLWRCQVNRKLPVLKTLTDGSYLSTIYPGKLLSAKQRRASGQSITVRVIDYALPGLPDATTRYRLITTLLDEKQAPALELATIYHERWEVEAVFDELKTHQLRGRRVLRSKSPDLVRQEFYGWVLAHYAVRWLMHQAASEHKLRHRDLSFAGNLQLLRRAQTRSGAFPPRATEKTQALV